jgi:Ca2+-binding RTX toxin-like protein
MATPIKRVGLIVTIALLLMVSAFASVAYAKTLVGTNGPDDLEGTNNRDTVYGLSGGDDINGKLGTDDLYGGRGGDEIKGRGHDDYIVGGLGHDELYGGFGDDRIEAADGLKDDVDCGTGEEDVASVDKGLDNVSDCEFVNGKEVD